MSETAKNLKSRREKLGMSQAELAEKSGVSLRTIQGWERGKTSDLERFAAVLEALGCKPFGRRQ